MTQCFLVTSTDIARVWLRRYVFAWDDAANAPASWSRCPGVERSHSAHGALLGNFPQPLDPVERVYHQPTGVPEIPHDDPRWPVKCDSCDYRFTPDDSWQYFSEHIYLDAQGREHFLRDATPGMMWHAPWYFDPLDPSDAERRTHALANPDVNHYMSTFYWNTWSTLRAPLCVNCPNGAQWCVDAKANNGPGWTVSGDAPMLTCSPSIMVPGYHGFLQGGVFTPNL